MYIPYASDTPFPIPLASAMASAVVMEKSTQTAVATTPKLGHNQDMRQEKYTRTDIISVLLVDDHALMREGLCQPFSKS